MNFIVLRAVATEEGTLIIEGLTSIIQKASGVTTEWIDLSKAKINCLEPAKCDLLFFPNDKEELAENLELWDIVDDSIAVISIPEIEINNAETE